MYIGSRPCGAMSGFECRQGQRYNAMDEQREFGWEHRILQAPDSLNVQLLRQRCRGRCWQR